MHHCLTLNTLNLSVWCYKCDEDLSTMANGPDGDSPQQELTKFVDSVQDLFFQFFNGTMQ